MNVEWPGDRVEIAFKLCIKDTTEKVYSVQISHSVMSDSLWPHGMQHDRLLCPSLTPGVHSNSCPLSLWCHPTISSSVIPFSSRTQSCPASGSFPKIQLFASGGKSTELQLQHQSFQWSQGWFPSGLIGLLSLLSKGLSKVFSNTTVQKHQFSGIQLYSPTLTSVIRFRFPDKIILGLGRALKSMTGILKGKKQRDILERDPE